MNLKRLFFWTIIFSLLLGYVLLIEKDLPEKKPDESGTRLTKVFSFSPEQMQRVEILQKNKKIILKKSSGSWNVVSPAANREIRQEAIQSIVSAITDTINIEIIKEKPEDLTQFGLSLPSTVLRIFIEEKKEPTVFILGSKTPTSISMYAMLKDKDTVIEIGTFLNSSINSFMANF